MHICIFIHKSKLIDSPVTHNIIEVFVVILPVHCIFNVSHARVSGFGGKEQKRKQTLMKAKTETLKVVKAVLVVKIVDLGSSDNSIILVS